MEVTLTTLDRTNRKLRHALVAALCFVGCGGASTDGDPQCSYGQRQYGAGQSFPASDGCNTCSCGKDGRVSCTLLACETCESVAEGYSAAMAAAKTCDPQRGDRCGTGISEGLACGCKTFVNDEASEFVAQAVALEQRYTSRACGSGIVCGPCGEPVSAFCSAEGRCESLFEDHDAACKVNGLIYKSGSGDIADPVSCNRCDCQDGELACTEIGCPIACPPGTAYGTQCAQCGPSDACNVVEHGCLPTCTTSGDCAAGTCVEQICRKICG